MQVTPVDRRSFGASNKQIGLRRMMSLDASHRLGSRVTPRFKKLRSIEELQQAPNSLHSLGSYSRDDTLMHLVTPDLPVSMIFSPLPSINQREHN